MPPPALPPPVCSPLRVRHRFPPPFDPVCLGSSKNETGACTHTAVVVLVHVVLILGAAAASSPFHTCRRTHHPRPLAAADGYLRVPTLARPSRCAPRPPPRSRHTTRPAVGRASSATPVTATSPASPPSSSRISCPESSPTRGASAPSLRS